MTSFNIRPEDAGIRNLRNERLKPRTTKAVGEVPPYPEVHPAKVGFHEAVEREVRAAQQPEDNDSKQELITHDEAEKRRPRGPDRRQHQAAILLDTRSGGERRLLENNPLVDLDSETEHKGLGVDLYT